MSVFSVRLLSPMLSICAGCALVACSPRGEVTAAAAGQAADAAEAQSAAPQVASGRAPRSAASSSPSAPASPQPAAGATTTSDGPEAVFETSMGNIVVRLFARQSPLSSQNMLQYIDAGFYDGLIFHRVISDFMVQGGGFDPQLKERATSRPGVRNESASGPPNRRGTLAMARTNDPDSARAQFFINVVDNAMLDARPGRPGYAVVGEVVSGMEVVDAIRKVPTRCPSRGGGGGASCDGLPPGMRDLPETPVIIRRARRQAAAAGPSGS